MLRHIHLDPVGGIAGDMFVAAMLDAFPDSLTACWRDIEAAGLLQHVNIELVLGATRGLAAKKFVVTLRETPAKRTGRYADLRQWLEQGELASGVKIRALAILHTMAAAEAHVHGVSIDDVHFHEIADWDSLVDVVAAASLIEHTAIDSWSCSALPLGSGFVNTEHGQLPVPAPATLHLLLGFPMWDDGDSGERVTPTGAAIVRYLFTGSDGSLIPTVKRASGSIQCVGCGAGQRTLKSRPNMLRVVVTESKAMQSLNDDILHDEVLQIAFDIDDMTPEELAVSLAYIREFPGVIDASFHMAMGKKGRASFQVIVMCQSEVEDDVCNGIFLETTTLGMRISTIQRKIVKRKVHTLADDMGRAGVKVAERPAGKTAKVESDDLATQAGLQARRLRAQQLVLKVFEEKL